MRFPARSSWAHSFCGLVAVLALAAPTVRAQSAPPSAEEACAHGFSLRLESQKREAAEALKTCAEAPGADEWTIARARLERFQILERLGERDAAEAELVILTSDPVSRFEAFNPSGAFSRDNGRNSLTRASLGASQPQLLARLAAYRLADRDGPGAILVAGRAILLAGRNPAAQVDVAAAYSVRAQARGRTRNQAGARADLVAAFLRGADDDYVKGEIARLPAAMREGLTADRAVMLEEAGRYRATHQSIGAHAVSDEVRQEVVSAGETALISIAKDEARFAGL
jgi:hypothetical protein